MERISGPHHGFYVASHACEIGEGGELFLGYAKICRRRPRSYWDADCLVKVCGQRLHASEESALAEAERHASDQLLGLVRPGAAAPA